MKTLCDESMALIPQQEEMMRKSQPSVIEYTNMLHRYGDPDARAARKYLERHRGDEVFIKRAAKHACLNSTALPLLFHFLSRIRRSSV